MTPKEPNDNTPLRALAEKIEELFWDEAPMPSYIRPKIESLLSSAMEEAKEQQRRDMEHPNRGVHACDLQIEQARAEGLKEGQESVNTECLKCRRAAAYFCRECHYGETIAARNDGFQFGKEEAYEHAAKIAENVKAEPMDEGNDPCHCVTYELTPSMIAEQIRQAAKKLEES